MIVRLLNLFSPASPLLLAVLFLIALIFIPSDLLLEWFQNVAVNDDKILKSNLSYLLYSAFLALVCPLCSTFIAIDCSLSFAGSLILVSFVT